MESESGPQSGAQRLAFLRREERETRWRLELAETRAHPFQLAKFFLAAPSV